MKKRVLSVLLIIALLVAVGIVAAQADGTETESDWQTIVSDAKAMTFEEGNIPTYCPKCGDNVTWTALTKELYDSVSTHAYGGHYYLAESFEIDYAGIAFNFQGPSCLHLNGNGIKNVTTGGWNCVLRGANELNIFDNAAGTGYIDGGTTQGAIWGGTGTTNIYGGTYKGTNDTATIEIRDNNFVNFFAGKLESGYIRFTTVDPSAFQMYGGTLSSTDSIKSNNASATTEALVGIHGGDVDMAVSAWGKKVVVTGGSIKTLTSAVPTGTSGISISGNPQIETLTLSSAYVYPTFGVLTEGASIGLGTYTGVISTVYEKEADAKAVAASFPAATGMEVTVVEAAEGGYVLSYGKRTTPYTPAEIIAKSNAMTFTGNAAGDAGYCYACMKDVTWMPLNPLTDTTTRYTPDNMDAGMHYYLNGKVTSSNTDGTIYLNSAKKLCLHLNNQIIENTTGACGAIRMWTNGCSLNVFGNGLVTSKSTLQGSLRIGGGSASTANIYGGTYRNDGTDQRRAINVAGAVTVNIYEAEIVAGTGAAAGNFDVTAGATVYIHDITCKIPARFSNADAQVYIKGGAFNNTVTNAGTLTVEGGSITKTVTNTGTLNISGGNVSGGINSSNAVSISGGAVTSLTATAGTVTLSGKPTITTLASSVAVDAKGLTGGSIGLGTTSGVFTTAFDSKDDAEAAIPYFTVEPGKKVTVTDNAELTYGTATTYTPEEIVELSAKQVFEGTDPVDAFCYACNKTVTWKPLTGPDKVYGGNMQSHYHWFIANDIKEDATSGTFYFASYGSQQTWCLHLNGKTIENTVLDGKDIVPAVIRQHNAQCIVNVMGDGKLISHGNVWSSISVAGGVNTTTGKPAGVNVYGGELYNDGENSWALTANGGFVNVYGGSIPSGALNVVGAEVNLYDADYKYINQNGTGTLTIHDGNYPNVRVYNAGEVNINGGTVSQLIANEKAGTIKLAGKPTVNAISLAEGKVLDLNGMTGGSLNVGSFNGVFSTAFTGGADAAETVAAFVTSSSKAIAVTDLNELTTAAAAAAVVNGNTQKAYATYADAETACTNGYIKLLSADDVNITKDVTIDLNGQSVTVSGSDVTLTGFDSTTKDNFSKAPATADIADEIEVTTPATTTADDGTVSGYIATTDNGFTSFSYYKMKLSGVALKAKKDAEGNLSDVGMYYKGTWSFNDYLPEGYVEAGVVVNIGDPNTLAPVENSGFWYSIDANAITNGEPVTSVLVDKIMTTAASKDTNTANGRTEINAAAFITINGETNILTGVKSLSVRDVLYTIETTDAFAANEAKLYGEGKFYDCWAPYVDFASWNLPIYSERVS